MPDGVEPVLEESVPAGDEVQVTVSFDEPGEYAVLTHPLTVGSAQRIGQGITIVEG